jgi:hypothetical protein
MLTFVQNPVAIVLKFQATRSQIEIMAAIRQRYLQTRGMVNLNIANLKDSSILLLPKIYT